LSPQCIQLFSLQKANSMQPTAIDIECLSVFPFFDDDFIMKLKSKLPTYLLKCADTHERFCPLQWLKQTPWNFHARQKLRTKPFYCNHLQLPLSVSFLIKTIICKSRAMLFKSIWKHHTCSSRTSKTLRHTWTFSS